ncbi:hypothetical protein FKP32DRAFT_1595044 [Trametes sanguinea]|nr:hypothetical protein FKP32DRAFT_1595044 [Trametes sanguinea]
MLKLQFPQDKPPKPTRKCLPRDPNSKEGWDVLEAYYLGENISSDLRVLYKERVAKGRMQVFRVTLYGVVDDAVIDDGRTAICKVAYGKRGVEALKKEADIYREKLAHLQGKWVPKIFGCYVGETVREALTCILLMEDCGQPLPRMLYWLPPQQRAQVVHGLQQVHRAGLKHGDFQERNLVIRLLEDETYWITIIDFGEAVEHDCPCKDWQLEMYSLRPSPSAFTCDELWTLCTTNADFWTPESIPFRATTFPSTWAAFNPADIVDRIGGFPADNPVKRESALEDVSQALQRYRIARQKREGWDGNPVALTAKGEVVGSLVPPSLRETAS